MRKLIGKLAAALAGVIIVSGTLAVSSDALRKKEQEGGHRYNSAVMRITKGENNSDDWNAITGYGDKDVGVMSSAEVSLINGGSSIISFDTDLSFVKPEYIKSSDFSVMAYFSVLTDAGKWYSCSVDVLEKPVITAGELLKYSGIPEDTKAAAVVVYENDGYNSSWFDRNDDYGTLFFSKAFIKGVRVVDTSAKGWVSADRLRWKDRESDVRKFYVDKPGSIARKSCTISKTRYKFGENGICGGKYTGWTKSSRGKSYWSNGTVCKNKWLTAKDGSRYYANGSGYVVTGTHVIKGRVYRFNKDGKCLGTV
ncbi:MAG: hypothetical protein ACI4J4_08175 [Ruminiclostridium sp.]